MNKPSEEQAILDAISKLIQKDGNEFVIGFGRHVGVKVSPRRLLAWLQTLKTLNRPLTYTNIAELREEQTNAVLATHPAPLPPPPTHTHTIQFVEQKNISPITTRILHISDTHAESKTLMRVQALVQDLAGVDVVAHTGDAVSSYTRVVPNEWNSWPHRVKLSVPGGHDHPETYTSLAAWNHRPPWYRLVDNLLFVGVDTSHGFRHFQNNYPIIPDSLSLQFSGFVILTHEWYRSFLANAPYVAQIGKFISNLTNGRPVLFLHGHHHEEGIKGLVWDSNAKLGDLTCFRSNVCSSHSANRGIAHLITWNGHTFLCEPRQAV